MQRIATDLLFRTSLLVGVLLTATTGVGQPVDVDKLRAKKEAAALTAPNENAPAAFQVTPGSQLIRVDPKPTNGFIRVVRPDKGPQAWIPQDVVELRTRPINCLMNTSVHSHLLTVRRAVASPKALRTQSRMRSSAQCRRRIRRSR